MTNEEVKNITLESLRDWFKKEKWVRISSSGNIAGDCGTSKDKKNPDRCLPKAKAQSLTKGQRAATAAKKKKAGSKGKTVVKNTEKATVQKEVSFAADQNVSKGYKYARDIIAHLRENVYKKLNDQELEEFRREMYEHYKDAVAEEAQESEEDEFAGKDPKAGTTIQGTGFNAPRIKSEMTKEDIRNLVVGTVAEKQKENTIMEKDDRCTRLAKSKYDTWPSAYASGAVVRCRRGEIWKKK